MLEIIDNKQFSKVKSIEVSNVEKPVYDIFVPNGNNYLANGFISHNTVMAVFCACKLGVKTIVIAKQHEFIANFYKDFMRFTNISKLTKHPDKIIKLIEGPEDLHYLKTVDIALITYQKFIRKDADEKIAKYINGRFSFAIVDECFEGSTEILTEKGWVKFKNLEKGIKVAQYNKDGTVSFVEPLRYIKKYYDKPLYKMNFPFNKSYVRTTANHNIVYKDLSGNICMDKAKNIKVTWDKKLIDRCQGVKGNKVKCLTDFERLMIALQADGTYQGCVSSYTISLSRKRKVKRFEKISKDFDVKPIKSKPGGKRWYVRLNNDLYKDKGAKYLTKTFKLEDFSYDKANDFIHEICLWDGYINPKTGLPQIYRSVIKENVDFVCAVGMLAGYHCRQTEYQDTRKSTYKKIYTVTFSKQLCMLRSPIKCKKPYNKDVYCVEVPSKMIVVRSKGVPFVCGNCHSGSAVAFAKFLNKLAMKYRLGLSATPSRKDGRHVIGKSIIGPVVAKSESVGLVPTIDILETGIHKEYSSTSRATWTYMLKFLYNSEKRNKLIVKWVFKDLKAGHKLIIIPTDYKKHLNLLLKMLTEEAKRRAKKGETINGEKIDWRNFAVGFYAGCPRDEVLKNIDEERYKVVVTIRSMMKEGVNMLTPSCIYIQTPMSASSNKEKISKTGRWQYIGSPFFYQLSTRICTAAKDKKQPVIRIFIDNTGPSIGCLRSLSLFEIMPGTKRGLNGENPKYHFPLSVQRRIFDILNSKKNYHPMSYSDFRAQYKQYDKPNKQ